MAFIEFLMLPWLPNSRICDCMILLPWKMALQQIAIFCHLVSSAQDTKWQNTLGCTPYAIYCLHHLSELYTTKCLVVALSGIMTLSGPIIPLSVLDYLDVLTFATYTNKSVCRSKDLFFCNGFMLGLHRGLCRSRY